MTDDCIDEGRIKKALAETRKDFDHMNARVSGFDEFYHHMELLFYRSNLFGLDLVKEHAKLYSYRMDEKSMSGVLSALDKHSFSM